MQLRQRLGAADDRHEVLVAGPARHDVLVQVRGDAGAGDAPWFIPMLKPWAPLTARITRIASWVSAATSAVSSSVRSG